MSEITTRNSQSIDREVMATGSDGNPRQIAMFSGRVTPGRSFTLSMNVLQQNGADEHREAVAIAADAFIAELRELAEQNGVPNLAQV